MTTETTKTTQQARVFTYLSDVISEAREVEPGQRGVELELPGTDELTTRVKVYISGGENEMHSHPLEDHTFFILEGTATFRIESDDNTVDVGAHEAILIPRGTRYWFTNTGDTNLALLRVGSGQGARYRLDANGNEMKSGGVAWKVNEGRAV